MRRWSGALWVVVLLAGVVASLAAGGPRSRPAARWVARDLGTLGGRYSAAVAVNDRDEVVGFSQVEPGGRYVWFVWRNGRMIDTAVPSSRGLEHAEINERGQVLLAGTSRGDVLWENGKVRSLKRLGGRRIVGGGVRAMNDRGQMVGDFTPNLENRGVTHAFYWDGKRLRDLGTLGGRTSSAWALNNRGQVVGTSDTRKPGVSHAFLWENGRMRDLGTLGGKGSTADAINERGQVIGTSEPAVEDPHGWPGFFWERGRMQRIAVRDSWLEDINDRGEVAGGHWLQWLEGSAQRAFVWRGGVVTEIGTFGGDQSNALAINNQGLVVGSAKTRTGRNEWFVWVAGAMTDLGHCDGGALAMSNKGHIAGCLDTGEPGTPSYTPPYHATLWTKIG